LRLLRTGKFPAPPLDPAEWSGDPLSLGSLRGRVVLLDFFSLGDPSGVGAFHRLRELGERYHEAGLSILGVHVPVFDFERQPETARRELWRLGVPWPVALDHALEIFRTWDVGALPARALVDGGGLLRGWQRGEDDMDEIEPALRFLIRENRPEFPMPLPIGPDPAANRPGTPTWFATPEVPFGTRGYAFADRDEEPVEGERTFEELPDLRAEGRPYLVGRWSVGKERIVLEGDEGRLAVVFEGVSATVVLSRREPGDEPPDLGIILDGGPPDGHTAGADVDLDEIAGTARVPVERDGVHELVAGAPFGLHNLEIIVRGRGTTFHGIRFGTADVPDVPDVPDGPDGP